MKKELLTDIGAALAVLALLAVLHSAFPNDGAPKVQIPAYSAGQY